MSFHRALLVASLALLHCGGNSTSHGDADMTSDAPTDGTSRTLSSPEMGIATYYAADGTGACSFDPSPNDLNVAAMDMPEWQNSAVCGECVHVVGPSGAVTVRIVDLCPECETGHLDLSMQAFAQIADPTLGRVSITWQVVSCDVQGPIEYRFKEGSSQWWVAIQVRNTRVPVAGLEAMVSGAWVALDRQDYNYFVAANGLGVGPFTLRVTSADGQQLTDTAIPLEVAQVVPGAQQFQ